MVPPGFAADLLRVCYQGFSYIPSLGRWIRVRWYRVQAESPFYGDSQGVYQFGSMMWDDNRSLWPGYGEPGWQNTKIVPCGPPPWPPVEQSGGQGGSAGGRVMGLLRAGVAAGRGTSSGLRILGRLALGRSSGRGSCSGLRVAGMTRAGVCSGKGKSNGSRFLGAARVGAAAGKGSIAGSRVMGSSRAAVSAGKGSSAGTSFPGTTKCTACAKAHKLYTVVVSGITNGTCSDCNNLNGTHTFTWSASCNWNGPSKVLCGAPAAALVFFVTGSGAGTMVSLLFPGGLFYSRTGAWDGDSAIVLTRSASPPSCATYPATLTLTPA